MELKEKAKVFAALSDPFRLRIIEILLTESLMCGKELAARLDASGALVSHHAKILEDAGILARKKEGQFSRFSLNYERLAELKIGTFAAASCVEE